MREEEDANLPDDESSNLAACDAAHARLGHVFVGADFPELSLHASPWANPYEFLPVTDQVGETGRRFDIHSLTWTQPMNRFHLKVKDLDSNMQIR